MRTIFSAFLSAPEEVSFLKEFGSDIAVFLVSSGTAALVVALSCLKYQSRKSQVILPAYSCPSVIAAIIKAGLKPVLCDLRPNCLGMDLDEVEARIGPDTLAIIAVHLFGIPENIIELKGIAQKRGIILIEDAAQAFGNKVHLSPQSSPLSANGYLGSFGDIGIFSFGRGKPFTLLAGGAISVNNHELLKFVQEAYVSLPQADTSVYSFRYMLNLLFYSIFYHPKLYWIPERLPWLKLGETIFTLSFGIDRINPHVVKLGNKLISNFDEIREGRLKITEFYIEKLKGFRDEFTFYPKTDGALLRFPIIFRSREKRDRILVELKKRGLGATGMYPVPLNEQEGVSPYLTGNETYPNAKFVSERILTLPIHEHVRVEDIEHIRQIIQKAG
jgi:dTDP-4-amino-4,6-dideoxygalactose transaminase